MCIVNIYLSLFILQAIWGTYLYIALEKVAGNLEIQVRNTTCSLFERMKLHKFYSKALTHFKT